MLAFTMLTLAFGVDAVGAVGTDKVHNFGFLVHRSAFWIG
jgi:hypothetical protein